MDVGIILVAVFAFLCAYLILSKPKGLPPGPFSLPLIGSYFFLKEMKGKCLYDKKLSQKYGKIFGFWIGSQFVVVLNGYDNIFQALVNQSDVFSDRPNFLPGIKRVFREENGIIMSSYNYTWKTLRRYTLQTLRDFGVGKTPLEQKIMVEIAAAMKTIDKSKGAPIEIRQICHELACNVVHGVVFGCRKELDDPEFEMIQQVASQALNSQGHLSIGLYLPIWLSWLLSVKEGRLASIRKQKINAIKDYIMAEIIKHEETFDANNIRDFIDLYIQLSRSNKDGVFTKGNMRNTIIQLFIAGTETTYNTLDWAFLFMAEYPEIQKKCQTEIDEMVGDKGIEYVDRVNLKYVDAVLTEIQRNASVAPLGVLHSTSSDTTLIGHRIPKDTVIVPNLFSANFDPAYCEEPHLFNPDRFLKLDSVLEVTGKLTNAKKGAPIPFSVGPRSCLGEPLARMELFLVFTNFLQKYSFKREDDTIGHPMAPDPTLLFARSPIPYRLRITKRY